MEGICVNFRDQVQFFRLLRDVATATNLVAKIGQNYLSPCTYRSITPKWNGISPSNMRINSSTNYSTSCERMVKISSVVFELKLGRK